MLNKYTRKGIKDYDKIVTEYDLKHDEIYNEIEQKRIFATIKDLLGYINKKNIFVLDFGAGTSNLTLKFLNDKKYKKELIKKGFENIKRFSWEKSAKEILNACGEVYNEK